MGSDFIQSNVKNMIYAQDNKGSHREGAERLRRSRSHDQDLVCFPLTNPQFP